MTRWAGGLMVSAMLVLGSTPGWAAEDRTVKAAAAWVGQGRFFSTGTETLYFVGAFSGILFVENGEGLLNAANIVCPGTLEVEVGGGKQRGEGRCVMTDRAGNLVFARWSCAGTHQVECKGSFALTGGTGRFSGISGQTEFRVRTAIAELAIGHLGEGIQETAAGLAEWPSFRYRIP